MRKSNTLSTLGLVLGILGTSVSFLPVLGMLGIVPGCIGIILSVMGYKDCKRCNISPSVAIIGIMLSSFAIIISGAQGFFINKARSTVSDIADKTYDSCDDLLLDYELTVGRLKDIKNETDNDLSSLKAVLRISTQLSMIEIRKGEMSCDSDSAFTKRYNYLKKSVDH